MTTTSFSSSQLLPALENGVIVTPTVVKVSPAPAQHIIGNLSKEEELLRALGLPETDAR